MLPLQRLLMESHGWLLDKVSAQADIGHTAVVRFNVECHQRRCTATVSAKIDWQLQQRAAVIAAKAPGSGLHWQPLPLPAALSLCLPGSGYRDANPPLLPGPHADYRDAAAPVPRPRPLLPAPAPAPAPAVPLLLEAPADSELPAAPAPAPADSEPLGSGKRHTFTSDRSSGRALKSTTDEMSSGVRKRNCGARPVPLRSAVASRITVRSVAARLFSS